MTIKTTLAALAFSTAALFGGVAQIQVAHAATQQAQPPRQSWSFAGPFGTYDSTQLQRGFKVYREVCSACHSIKLLAFRNLSEPGGPEFSEGQVKALAAEYRVMDGPNESGEMFERAARPADRFPSPFPNRQAAQAANGGAYPPDFSVIAKARTYERGFPWFLIDIFTQFQEQGVDYLTALLTGYEEPPQGFDLPAGKYYNKYFPGNVIAMPQPVSDGQIEYPKTEDGRPQAPETALQYSKDLSAFLMWAAEPHLEQRKEIGFKALMFLLLFGSLLYFTKKRIWSRIEGHANA